MEALQCFVLSNKNIKKGPDVVVHAYNPSTQEMRQIVSFRPAWAAKWDPVSKHQDKKKKKTLKKYQLVSSCKTKAILAPTTKGH
jgi:hypothetical protein